MSPVLDAALAFHDAGCSVIRAAADGTKAPVGTWKNWQAARPGPEQLTAWFGDGHPGIGIVTGRVSGNLDMLEFEGRAVAEGYFGQAAALAEAAGLGDTWNRLMSGYMEVSPSGGLHFPYRLDGQPVPPNTKLAERPAFDHELTGRERADVTDRAARGISYWPRRTLMETRGEGGFTVVAPSCGPVHPTGRPWMLARGSIATIPVLTAAEHTELYRVIRSLDQMPAPAADPFTQPGRPGRQIADGDLKPGEDYALRTDWADILKPEGWHLVSTAGTVRSWRRPGKDHGVSATTGRPPYDNLYVFSTSTEFDPLTPVSKFRACAVLRHGGDYSAAASELRQQGYGTPLPVPAVVPVLAVSVPPQPGQDDGPARTSWRPLDLTAILDGDTAGDPPPLLLTRADGRALLYAGKVNALIGESESGKTWIALAAAAQAMHAGLLVAYLDFEDAPAGITGRLAALGATRAQLEKLFRYIAPDEPLTPLAGIDLAAVLAERPALAVVDGVNAAMSLLGLNLKDNKDVTDFSQRLLRPLKRSGAAVLTVDHVTKNKDDRGTYAIGAQAKRADIDGAAFIVEAIRKFGRGQTGELRLTVSKDRPGHVRAISAGAEYAGTAHLTSHDDGSITVTIDCPDLRPASEKPPWRPTGFMERISVFLEQCETGASLRAIRESIGGKSEHLKIAILRLSEEGYITLEAGPRNATIHRSSKPFRQEAEPAPVTVTHRDPTVTDDLGSRSSGGSADRDPETGYKPSAYPGGGHGRAAGGEVTVTATVPRGTGGTP